MITENITKTINLNKNAFTSVLNLIISAGQILDQMKKHAFYGSEYKQESMLTSLSAITNAYNDLIEGTEVLNLNDAEEEIIPVDTRIAHGIIGNITESVELGEALMKIIKTGEVDGVNIGEEIADGSWYNAITVDALGLDWDQLLVNNINKLKQRYPEAFTQSDAENRDLDKEREILETE